MKVRLNITVDQDIRDWIAAYNKPGNVMPINTSAVCNEALRNIKASLEAVRAGKK
jgi:hypothetical protein